MRDDAERNTQETGTLIPVGRVVRSGGLKAVLHYYQRLGDEFIENLRSMLVFDAVIYNEDRHFGNFGFLRDNRSGAILRPAPLFDHGISLFNFAMPDDISDLDTYAKTRFPAYPDVTFESIYTELCGKAQAAALRRLIGFTFKRHPLTNWPEERLCSIERHIQSRIRQLLELTRTVARSKKPLERDTR